MKKATSEKLAYKLDKLVRAIKDEIVWYVNKYGERDGELAIPAGKTRKSVTINGYSYTVDCVRTGWYNTDYTVSIDSDGLNYSCATADELMELLQILEETFNN